MEADDICFFSQPVLFKRRPGKVDNPVT